MSKQNIIVGYWRKDVDPDVTGLPYPEQIDKKDDSKYFQNDTRQSFISCLARVEKKAHQVAYRGWSTCRLCGKMNGSYEFEYAGYTWPSGLKHYLEDHNIKPPNTDWVSMILLKGSMY